MNETWIEHTNTTIVSTQGNETLSVENSETYNEMLSFGIFHDWEIRCQ